MKITNVFLQLMVTLAACQIGIMPSQAASIALDFDSPPLSAGQCTDGTGYLGGFGITFVPITPGGSPVICNGTGLAASATSAPNWFGVNAPPNQSNAPLSYQLDFSDEVVSISFTRVGIISVSTGPPWIATAFGNGGVVLDRVSESRTVGSPAQTFMLKGPGIKSLRLDADNSVRSTFTDPPLDDLRIVTTPEPATLAVCASILLLGVAVRRARRRMANV